MKAMSPRDRVLAALSHTEPDRVPAVLEGSYYMLNDQTYFSMLKHFSLGEAVPPFRPFLSRNSNYYDDRILDRLETDVRYVWCGFSELGGARMQDTCCDAWGVRWRQTHDGIVCVSHPLAGADGDAIEKYPWPDPVKFFDFGLIKDRLQMLRKAYPAHAIAARAVNSYGPFEQAADLRGREDFYVDLLADPDLARLILRKCTDVIVRANEAFLEAVGNAVDFFEIPGDDYGSTQSLMVSPSTFTDLIKPELARIVRSVKDFRRDLPVAFHSDGAIQSIIGDLADVGLDILNPLEPLPAVDWKKIKNDYGHRLCFMGGVDIRQALRGSVKDVQDDVRRCIDTFAPGGGYLLTSANHLQMDIPAENIVAMFEAGRKLGRYPLDLRS